MKKISICCDSDMSGSIVKTSWICVPVKQPCVAFLEHFRQQLVQTEYTCPKQEPHHPPKVRDEVVLVIHLGLVGDVHHPVFDHEAHQGNVGADVSLFSAPEPVRLPAEGVLLVGAGHLTIQLLDDLLLGHCCQGGQDILVIGQVTFPAAVSAKKYVHEILFLVVFSTKLFLLVFPSS